MTLPTGSELQSLDFAWRGAPFARTSTKSTLDPTTLDVAYVGGPFGAVAGYGEIAIANAGDITVGATISTDTRVGFPAQPFNYPVFESGLTTYRSGANNTGHPIDLPNGVEAGDLLLAFLAIDGSPTVTWDDSTAGVWAPLVDTSQVQIRYKIADGTESGLTLTVSTSASEISAPYALRISNVHGTTPIEISTVASDSTAYPDPPSFSPSWGAAKTLWIAFAQIDGGSDFSITGEPGGSPSGYDGFTVVSAGTSSTGASLAFARKQAEAASDDPGPFTALSAALNHAYTIGIQPPHFIADASVGSVSITMSSNHLVGTAIPPIEDATVGAIAVTFGTDAFVGNKGAQRAFFYFFGT